MNDEGERLARVGGMAGGVRDRQRSNSLKGKNKLAQGKERRDAALGSRHPKNQSPEGVAQMPETWTAISLAEIGDWRGGGTPSKAKPEFWTNGTIPWVSPKDMKQPKISGAFDLITEEAVKESATSLLTKESVLMVTRSGILSHSLPVAVNTVPVALNQDIKAVTPTGATTASFLWHAFNCFERDILNACRKGGTTVHSIEFPALQAFQIPLPPLNEQKRIVAKIEELFSELGAGEESFRQARRQLDVYRQSLLKQAFEGKLTAAWRERNPNLLESPDQLLQRIQEEREKRYEEQVKAWDAAVAEWKAKGKKDKKPSAPKKPSAIDKIYGSELNDLPKLPMGWGWFRFGDIVSVSSGEGLTASMMKGGVFHVYGGNGISGMHDEFRHGEPRLIIGRVGAKCGVVHITKPKSWVTDNALIADFSIISANMKFFQLLFSFKDLNKQSVSTAQPVVSGAKLNPLPMQFCSLPEQQEIVRLLDEQFTVIEQNERELDAALKRSEALRQSILKKAFSGQLVPQDPIDEPADTLLARIRAERKAAPEKKVRTKKKVPKL